MAQIAIIDSCYSELEKIKAEMIAEKKRNDEPERTTYSEVVCMLILEYYSSKRMGGASPPVSNNLSGRLSPSIPISDWSETKSIQQSDNIPRLAPKIQEGDSLPQVITVPSLKTTRLKFDVPKARKGEFLDRNMEFYMLHQNDLDDVSIVGNDIIIETRFVAQYRRFMDENNFMEK